MKNSIKNFYYKKSNYFNFFLKITDWNTTHNRLATLKNGHFNPSNVSFPFYPIKLI